MTEGTQLKDAARQMLAKIPVEEKRELIAKSRWTCDSHWMMSTVLNSGWDQANKINMQVARSVGKAEMHRLMKLLGLGSPKNEKEFMMLVTLAMETFITKDYFDYEFKSEGKDRWTGIVHQCYAYTKVRSIGVEKDYECGCFGLRAGWYEAMGMEVKEKLIKCMKDGEDRCEIILEKVAYPQ